MQRIIVCTTVHERNRYFLAAQQRDAVTVMMQPAGSHVAHDVATLPLREAIRAANDLNRATREVASQAMN